MGVNFRGSLISPAKAMVTESTDLGLVASPPPRPQCVQLHNG